MDHQLEFIDFSENGNILVGSSQLVNSFNWTGELWYYFKEEDIISDNDVISSSESKYLRYPLTLSVSAGTFLNTGTKMLVGNDVGLLAVYSIGEYDDYHTDGQAPPSNASIGNDVGSTQHDRSILSISVSNVLANDPKAVTGGMDCGIKVWDIEAFTPEISYDLAHSSYVTCVRFQGATSQTSDSGAVFVSAALDGRCLLWDRRQNFPARVLYEEEDARFNSVEWFSDSPHSLFLGCESGKIRFLDTRNSRDVIFVHNFARNRPINTIRSYCHDSKKYLAVCGDSRLITVYQYDESLNEIYSNESHVDYVKDITWIKNKEKLLSCSWDSRIIKHYPFGTTDPEKDTVDPQEHATDEPNTTDAVDPEKSTTDPEQKTMDLEKEAL